MPSSRFHGWFVAIAAALVLLVRLGGPALWDDDEPKNAACSLAMLDSGDWVVPTFNGRLRIEKPPLVNWLQMAGFAVCGRNETGARIGSALLTIGTCLLTWRIGCLLVGRGAGLLGGLAMATCVWTAVGGRASTPDAPLLFCTTLALFFFVRGVYAQRGCAQGACVRGDGLPTPLPPSTPALSLRSAAAVGAACGAAVLAKGPVGLVLPLAAFALFALWTARRETSRAAWGGLAAIRPLAIVAAAALVAAPWYAWVTVRTDGAWLRGFLLVHNVGRFTSTMEGHDGSIFYYPVVVACGLFPWSIVLAATIWHATTILRSTTDDGRQTQLSLLACWALAWIGGFSCAGTKLPGYVWPAYPAVAIATGLFLDDWARGRLSAPAWCRRPELLPGRVMRVAWSILAVTGLAFAVGLPVAAARIAPGGWWLGLVGIIPCVTAAIAWRSQTAGRPARALAALAVGACLLVASLASLGAEWFSGVHGPRQVVARLGGRAADARWAYLWNVPPSLVFYSGGSMRKLDTAAEVAAHLAADPRALVVIDSRQESLVMPALPPTCGVLCRMSTLSVSEYLLIGPLPAQAAAGPLACND